MVPGQCHRSFSNADCPGFGISFAIVPCGVGFLILFSHLMKKTKPASDTLWFEKLLKLENV
jgi:hypothetical protein